MISFLFFNARSVSEEAFFEQFARAFLAKGAPAMNLEKNWGVFST
jgi:hypothetical protein